MVVPYNSFYMHSDQYNILLLGIYIPKPGVFNPRPALSLFESRLTHFKHSMYFLISFHRLKRVFIATREIFQNNRWPDVYN